MRRIQISVDEHYHIYNRGNDKQNIFLDNRDWIRFLFLILYFQFSATFYNLSRYITYYVKHRVFNISVKEIESLAKDRNVELVSFTFMPNHFHILVKELKEGGISYYMQRVLDAYAKYFNTKYKRSGHLFQGPYKIVHVKNNEQLLHLSAYIHRNPREIKKWKDKESKYPWSSFQDCIKENRWRELLKHQIITEQFSNPKKYQEFVNTSGTKLKTETETDEFCEFC